MKELSINEKAKAYDEAIERAKKLYGNEIAEEIFHELKECDDERIKKNCIHFLELQKQHHAATFEIEECIAWLEKQGEQNLSSANERAWLYLVSDVLTWKDGIGQYLDDPRVQELAKRLCSKYAQKLYNSPILSNSSNTGKNEQKSADKIEPRFEVGDWVVFITSESVYQVEKKENYEYTLRHILGGSMCLPFSNEKLIREWTIQDAKDGDVICYRDEISLYKHDIKNCTKQETTFGGFVYYCCYDGKRFITDSLYMLTKQDEIDIHPATKEQRDVLMKVMNDAGYEWNADKKELKKEKAK